MMRISRRAILKGAGVSLALPWLEAMAAETQQAPVRMGFLYVPNGANMSAWRPDTPGVDFKLSKGLEPLKDLLWNILEPMNLWYEATQSGDGPYSKVSA